MKLKDLEASQTYHGNNSVIEAFKNLQGIIDALKRHNLPEEIVIEVNRQTKAVNFIDDTEKKLLVRIKTAEDNILGLVRKKMGIIPEKYHTFLWMPIGMAAFGLPLGTGIFAITGNAAFIGLGLPIGMGIGVVLGMGLDRKAEKENKVLIIEQVSMKPDKD